MRKYWLNLAILAALFLTACQAAAPAQPAATAGPQVAQFPPPEDPQAVKMECTVVSGKPTPEPTMESAFPSPSKEDWSLGNTDNPTMTVIEYSDFQ